MSNHGVYDDEMPDVRFLDGDVELLLTGGVPKDQALAKLAPLVASMHARYTFAASDEKVAWFGAVAARIAEESRPAAAEIVSRSSGFGTTLKRRLVPVLASSVLLVGLTGVAYAADGSAPGDALYGLDRALEAIGIGNGGATERITEAQELFADGQVAASVALAAEVLEISDSAAAQALLDAAEELRANQNGGDNALEVRDEVADMLEWMATTDATGKVFGQGVAERAKGISDGIPGGTPNEHAADNASDHGQGGIQPQDDQSGGKVNNGSSGQSGRP